MDCCEKCFSFNACNKLNEWQWKGVQLRFNFSLFILSLNWGFVHTIPFQRNTNLSNSLHMHPSHSYKVLFGFAFFGICFGRNLCQHMKTIKQNKRKKVILLLLTIRLAFVVYFSRIRAKFVLWLCPFSVRCICILIHLLSFYDLSNFRAHQHEKQLLHNILLIAIPFRRKNSQFVETTKAMCNS